jgi:DNA recombination protein RmuC
MNPIIAWTLAALCVCDTVLLIVLAVRILSTSGGVRKDDVQNELRLGRQESADAARNLREEVAHGIRASQDSMTKSLGEITALQKTQLESVAHRLENLTETNQASIQRLRDVLDERMKELLEKNERKLEEMRTTVDEKLQTTLEKRLGDSFKLVSERLEAVQRGLGEMQGLASGVGDLKRVLTNVKTRGTWGEFQLGSILEQVLAPSQYQQNVQTREDSRDSVEYAVKLPGKDDGADSQVWLPIDSKFPQEDYQRLLDAVDASDPDLVEKTGAALMRTIRIEAQRIHDKYLNPPKTTDFAIMFLPTEGLYSEVLRKPGVVEDMQRKYRIVVAGPTTLAAILSSLRMGFHTLAIEKRASEVWKILAAVKTEFGKFGDVLERVRRQLAAATNTIEETGKRTRVMEKRLKDVEHMPAAEAARLLGADAAEIEVAEAEPEPGDSEDGQV